MAITLNLAAHEEAVVAEVKDLEGKLNYWKEFITTDAWNTLKQEEQTLVHNQIAHMQNYANMLDARVAQFVKKLL